MFFFIQIAEKISTGKSDICKSNICHYANMSMQYTAFFFTAVKMVIFSLRYQ